MIFLLPGVLVMTSVPTPFFAIALAGNVALCLALSVFNQGYGAQEDAMAKLRKACALSSPVLLRGPILRHTRHLPLEEMSEANRASMGETGYWPAR